MSEENKPLEACEADFKFCTEQTANHPHGRIYFGESGETGVVNLRVDLSDLDRNKAMSIYSGLERHLRKVGTVDLKIPVFSHARNSQGDMVKTFVEYKSQNWQPTIETVKRGNSMFARPVIRNLTKDLKARDGQGLNGLLSTLQRMSGQG